MSDAEDLPLASLTSVVELIGNYVVERELGGGATGRVLACRDQDLGRDVAIKILHDDLLADDVAIARFKREGQVLAKIDSPCVVRVHQVGVHGKVPYIVMERVDGQDAEAALKESGPLPLERVLASARDIAKGLAAVHAAGVLHRDVKPSNVLLSAAGAKLGDFGLAAPIEGSAQLTQAGTIPGTAATMAPERLRNVCDARSDLYALGCTIYALASGAMPFERASPIEVLAAHANEPAPRLACEGPQGAALASLVDRLLYKSPDKRPQTAAEVVQLLEEIISLPARRQEIDKREALARKLEVLLGPDSEVPKIPEVPSVDALLEPEAPSGTSSSPPAETAAPVPVTPAGAAPVPVTPAGAAPVATSAPVPEVTAPTHARGGRAGAEVARTVFALAGSAAGVALAAALSVAASHALAGGGNAADAEDLDDVAAARARIDDGEAEQVLQELRVLGNDERPVHSLIRGHALAATGATEAALGSFEDAARGKVVDARALEIAIDALDDENADAAFSVLVAWPTDEVVASLAHVIEEGDWWPRHHALAVLDRRKQSDKIDVTALGVRDLREGPTCNKRKHGLTILKERGQGKDALAAIDAAQKRADNGCIWMGDWDAARRALRARGMK